MDVKGLLCTAHVSECTNGMLATLGCLNLLREPTALPKTHRGAASWQGGDGRERE